MKGDCYLIVGLSCYSCNTELQKRQKLFATMKTVYTLLIISLRVRFFRMHLQLEPLSYFSEHFSRMGLFQALLSTQRNV